MVDLHVVQADDWALARELRLAALEDSPAAFLETLADAEARDEPGWRARVVPSAHHRQLVARDDAGAWIGSMTLYASDDDRVWLVAVWVEPGYRGTGVAEELLRAQLAWARSGMGADRVFLHVGDGNPRARRLYERVGFRATGNVETFSGHDGDEVEMVVEI